MAKQTWTVKGKLCVSEAESTGTQTIRDLQGIEVDVAGSTISNSVGWNTWGTARTDKNGGFALQVSKDQKDRFIRVRVRFRGNDLEIKGAKLNVLESNWHLIYKSTSKKDGPTIDIGTRTFGTGSAHDLDGEDARRQAVAWYLCRTTIDTLANKDSYFAFKKKINVVYPAIVVSKTPYANGVDRTAYIHKDKADLWWGAETVLHEIMHLWNYDHNKGTANWFDAVCGDWNTHGHQEKPNIAFHEGFAQYAAEELLYHIWGHEKQLPYNRKYFYDRDLHDLDMVERNDKGVISGLHLLTARGKLGPYKFVFGTRTSAPEDAGIRVGIDKTRLVGCPDAPQFTFWDVLRAFNAHPKDGWDSEWEVGKNDYGLIRFYDRCCDIYDTFDRETRDLLLDLLNPSKTNEPRAACKGLKLETTPKAVSTPRKPSRPLKR